MKTSLPSVCVVASTTVLNGPGCDDDASRQSTPLNDNCRGEDCGEFDGGGVRRRENQGGGGRARPSNSTGGELGELGNEGPGRDIAPVPADGREHQEETFLLPLCQQTASNKAGRDVSRASAFLYLSLPLSSPYPLCLVFQSPYKL